LFVGSASSGATAAAGRWCRVYHHLATPGVNADSVQGGTRGAHGFAIGVQERIIDLRGTISFSPVACDQQKLEGVPGEQRPLPSRLRRTRYSLVQVLLDENLPRDLVPMLTALADLHPGTVRDVGG